MTKINFCYHATALAIWFSIVCNLTIPRHGLTNLSSECRTMHDLNRIALLHPYFVKQRRRLFSYNSTILQFSCNFSLVVVNSFCLFVVFFVCFFAFCFFFFFHFVYLVTNRFLLNILLISCSMQVSFIFNMYMQLIIAGLKTSLHLTPFCLLELILAIIKNGKNLSIKYRGLSDC